MYICCTRRHRYLNCGSYKLGSSWLEMSSDSEGVRILRNFRTGRWLGLNCADPQVTIPEATTIGINSGNIRWNPILAIVQWNLCNLTPEFSDILWHPTTISGPKDFLLQSLLKNLVYSRTCHFWHPTLFSGLSLINYA